MKRDYGLYLNDINESIFQIEEYTKNVSENNFKIFIPSRYCSSNSMFYNSIFY